MSTPPPAASGLIFANGEGRSARRSSAASARRRRRRSPKRSGAKHTILYRDEDFAKRVGEITKGAKCHVVYDGVGKATFPASLDCLRPFGVFASFGSASGAVEAFNIGLLAQKGSLFATRPTLTTFMADRALAEKMARDLFRVVGQRRRQDPDRPALAAGRGPAGPYGAREARNNRLPASHPREAESHGLSCAKFTRHQPELGASYPPLYRRRGGQRRVLRG